MYPIIDPRHASYWPDEVSQGQEAIQKHMYCSPDVDAFLSGRGVYLISDHLSPEDLKDKFSFEDVNVLSQALDNGTAAFHPIPNEHLGLAASGTVLDMYLDDLQTPVDRNEKPCTCHHNNYDDEDADSCKILEITVWLTYKASVKDMLGSALLI